jgi:hypothetical protein
MYAEANELIAAIGRAVSENDDDKTDSLLDQLTRTSLENREPLDSAIDSILAVLTQTQDPANNCVFFVFLWLERVFGELGEMGKSRIKQFVAERYGRYSGIVAMEMADFIGGFRDEWGIQVVSDWISRCETFTDDAAGWIDIAIRELEEEPAGTRGHESYYKRVQQLASRFAVKKRALKSSPPG